MWILQSVTDFAHIVDWCSCRCIHVTATALYTAHKHSMCARLPKGPHTIMVAQPSTHPFLPVTRGREESRHYHWLLGGVHCMALLTLESCLWLSAVASGVLSSSVLFRSDWCGCVHVCVYACVYGVGTCRCHAVRTRRWQLLAFLFCGWHSLHSTVAQWKASLERYDSMMSSIKLKA